MRKRNAGLILGAMVASPAAAQQVDLSPARWPAAELAKYDSLTHHWGRPVPLALGRTDCRAPAAIRSRSLLGIFEKKSTMHSSTRSRSCSVSG